MKHKTLQTWSTALMILLTLPSWGQGAYKAITLTPGSTVTIQAEDYNTGGRGIAYTNRQNNYVCPTGDRFPILAWHSILPAEELTKKRFEELAECGFNLSLSSVWGWDKATMLKSMDSCRGTGVQQILPGSILDVAPEFKDNDMVACWYLKDEPNYSEYADLRAYKDRVRAIDDTHQLYLNLFPTYASETQLGINDYSKYVQKYADTIGLGIISYDHYPIKVSSKNVTSLRTDYYENLQRVSAICRATNQPLWAFCCSTSHYGYSVTEKWMMRLQVFSDLAYGAQCIQYFTYWLPTGWEGPAPIGADGKRTEVYDLVKTLNQEVRNLTPIFLGAKVVQVGHIGSSIPLGAAEFKKRPECFSTIKASGTGCLVSHLKNGDNEYLMLVNHSITNSQSVRLVKSSGVSYNIHQVTPEGELTETNLGNFTIKVGDYLLFQWNQNENN